VPFSSSFVCQDLLGANLSRRWMTVTCARCSKVQRLLDRGVSRLRRRPRPGPSRRIRSQVAQAGTPPCPLSFSDSRAEIASYSPVADDERRRRLYSPAFPPFGWARPFRWWCDVIEDNLGFEALACCLEALHQPGPCTPMPSAASCPRCGGRHELPARRQARDDHGLSRLAARGVDGGRVAGRPGSRMRRRECLVFLEHDRGGWGRERRNRSSRAPRL